MNSINIKQFPFNNNLNLNDEEAAIDWIDNWPTIYILNNEKEAYVGETYKIKERIKQHLQNNERIRLTKISIIIDEEANKSYTLDIEASLIRYMAADDKFKLQNGNRGLVDYNYFNKKEYRKKFESEIWPKLKKLGLARRDLIEIENDDIFKYSPYIKLSITQYEVVERILEDLFQNISNKSESGSVIVEGGAGTGKTVIGSYLTKLLKSKNENYEDKNTKEIIHKIQDNLPVVGFVVPQQSLRKTLKRVFSNIADIYPWMVLSPNDVAKSNQQFDILIIDEAHRLRQRRNLTNYAHFDENNKKLGLPVYATELDWILKKSKFQVFFYDADQTVKPTDISKEYFDKLVVNRTISKHKLFSQFRVLAGEDYIKYIKDILNGTATEKKNFGSYDLKLFDNISEFRETIVDKNTKLKLCRLVAGYGWKWNTRRNPAGYDIEIDGEKFIWNTTDTDWVNNKNSINEVGCIHTIQGYDLNYAGVIFGPEITYSESEKKIKILKDNYYDTNGKAGVNNPAELERYIKNIYSVLLSRGIKGTYIYAVDSKLRAYLKRFIDFQ